MWFYLIALQQEKDMDRGLNCAILHIAGKLYPGGYSKGGAIIDAFADPEVTWAFEAWVAWCRMKSFDPLPTQVEHLKMLYGDSPQTRAWAIMLRGLHPPPASKLTPALAPERGLSF
jgi:hypothetical protein